MLEQESKNVVKGIEALKGLLEDPSGASEKRGKIKEIEGMGDDIVHRIYEQLRRTFMTPIDQEDIAKLASLYDDVLDYAYAVANRMFLYDIGERSQAMKEFGEIVTKAVAEADEAFSHMRKINRQVVNEKLIEIERLENEADELLNQSVAELFREDDVKRIMKLKEIYESLEIITDRCADLATVIRDIVIKYT